MVFERDPREMLREVPSRLPLSVVKHEHEPTRSVKMMEQAQNAYPRKNWSSVMLFNCDHPANRRLSLWDVNHRTRQNSTASTGCTTTRSVRSTRPGTGL